MVKASDRELRKLTREAKDKWWRDKARYMQLLADSHQLGEFYNEVRKLLGNSNFVKVPLKSIDGSYFLKSKEEVLRRWSEHFDNLLNVDRTVDLTYISDLLQLQTEQHNKRAVGLDLITAKIRR